MFKREIKTGISSRFRDFNSLRILNPIADSDQASEVLPAVHRKMFLECKRFRTTSREKWGILDARSTSIKKFTSGSIASVTSSGVDTKASSKRAPFSKSCSPRIINCLFKIMTRMSKRKYSRFRTARSINNSRISSNESLHSSKKAEAAPLRCYLRNCTKSQQQIWICLPKITVITQCQGCCLSAKVVFEKLFHNNFNRIYFF